MKLDRLTVAQKFEIWQPTWSKRTVKLADFKLRTHNEVVFPKAPTMPGSYYISAEEAKSHPLVDMKTKLGGTIKVREVPISVLEPLERE